jgi:hypothetical protein
MEEHIPPRMYKYQSLALGSHTEANLESRWIWCSKPESLNDPFDCAVPYIIETTDDDLKEILTMRREELADRLLNSSTLPESAKEFLRSSRETNKSLSAKDIIFIENSLYISNKGEKIEDMLDRVMKEGMDKRLTQFKQWGVACLSETFNNILLWSHYADGHKGICLEFDTSCFSFNDLEKMHKVVYDNSYPTLTSTTTTFCITTTF